jgi:hypothetical protein
VQPNRYVVLESFKDEVFEHKHMNSVGRGIAT